MGQITLCVECSRSNIKRNSERGDDVPYRDEEEPDFIFIYNGSSMCYECMHEILFDEYMNR